MKPFLRQQLERYAIRLEELDFLPRSSPTSRRTWTRYRTLTREHAEVSEVAGLYERFRQREGDLAQAREMLDDPEMADIAREEITATEAELAALEDELQRLLLPKDPDDERNIFLEIRAGTGGDESALFAGDLFRMYTRYAERAGLAGRDRQREPGELGGYKEVVVRDRRRRRLFGKLKFESGGAPRAARAGHRDAGTHPYLACTVAVLPEADEVEAVQINPADLRIDTYRASAAPAASTSTRPTRRCASRTCPTGIVVECQDDRSQHKNKAEAMAGAGGAHQGQAAREQQAKEAATRKGLIGTGDRSDASAPTTSRRAASPTTASTSPCTSCRRWRASWTR